MGKDNDIIMSFKCKIPKLRHDVNAGLSAFITFYAYYRTYANLRELSPLRQFFILLITYAGYAIIMRAGFNICYALLYPHRVIVSREGAYIRGYGKQIEIVRHEGYKIFGKSGVIGFAYVEDALAVRLRVRNATRLIFIDDKDGKAEERLKNLGL